MKLIQKQFLKGSREFEIASDVVNVRIKTPFKEEKLTIGLTTLDPEPVINGPCLEFNSRAHSGPLLSLFINKPNASEFNAFVDALKQRVREEYSAFAELKAASQPAGLAANVYEEPPEFEETVQDRLRSRRKAVNVDRVDNAIQMLERYLVAEEIKPLLTALQVLKAEPENEAVLDQLENAFNDLGPRQGAVLTYAPYIGILLSDVSSEFVNGLFR